MQKKTSKYKMRREAFGGKDPLLASKTTLLASKTPLLAVTALHFLQSETMSLLELGPVIYGGVEGIISCLRIKRLLARNKNCARLVIVIV